jgi:hypothetical protein
MKADGERSRTIVVPWLVVAAVCMLARNAGQLDWWVKERQQWLGRVRGPDGRQRWVKSR